MIYVFRGNPRRAWCVSWTDVSQGYHFRCVVGNLSKSEAAAKLEEFTARRRRYYGGVMDACCPFKYERAYREALA